MPIELTTAQAEKVAELARTLGNRIALHEIPGGTDVYVGPVGAREQFLVSANGEASHISAHPAANV